MCRRSSGDGLEERRDRHGVPYWLHLPEGVELSSLRPNRTGIKIAEPRVLHVVYGTVLQQLPLSKSHLDDWIRRGVSSETVKRHHVRSWPPGGKERARLANRLYLEFGDQMRGVPGWFIRDGKPMLAGGSGWTIPMFDLASGCICAFRIRSDSDKGTKYYWLSSSKRGGVSPGIHARLAWPGRAPRRGDRSHVVRVTEGEAKSVVLAERTGIPTLSVPGVAMWTLALPWLRWLKTRRVLLCFDTDRYQKKEVAAAYLAAARGLHSHGLTVRTETWGARSA